MTKQKTNKPSLAWSAFALLFKVLVSVFVLATPVFGVWVGSSLAAFDGRPRWVPVVAGLAAFPLLPLAWDAFSEWRRRKKRAERERILTFWDRLLLRTFALNFAFLAILLASKPEAAFEALSTRGDWMLRGRHGQQAETARGALFWVAGKLEWLYRAAHDNRFDKLAPDDANPNVDDGKAGHLASAEPVAGSGGAPPTPAPSSSPAPADTTDRQNPKPPPEKPAHAWPFAEELEPAVRDMPPSAETDIASVAHYIADHEKDPFLRIKALHDWVADRVAYDADALADGRYPPQDANTVLRSRKAVCAGYAETFVALARAVGENAVYLTGDARTGSDDFDGLSHAWNAVKIEGHWYLLDATWDSGSVEGRHFEKHYRTDYFLTPPEVFGIDHFPSTERWQLRESALTRGEFMRQPMMTPSFFARGMKLVRPDRSQVDVTGALDAVIENPHGQFLLATSEPKGGGLRTNCGVTPGATLSVHCALPGPGIFRVLLFANQTRAGRYDQVGTLEAVAR